VAREEDGLHGRKSALLPLVTLGSVLLVMLAVVAAGFASAAVVIHDDFREQVRRGGNSVHTFQSRFDSAYWVGFSQHLTNG